MKDKKTLNGATGGEREFVAAYLQALELDGEPFIAHWIDEPDLAPIHPDGLARIRFRAEEIEYAVQVKRAIGKNNMGVVLELARQLNARDMRLLICTPYVPPHIAKEFKEHAIDYLDEAGNALIRGDATYIQIGGFKPKPTTIFTRALTATDTKILGAYLAEQETRQMLIKNLATTAGIAIGAVGKAREKLKAHGLLTNHGKRDWRIQNRAKALMTFAEHWGTQLRPKLAPTAYMPINTDEHGPLEQRIAALELGDHKANPDYLIGGEYAAALMTKHLRTDFATFHVREGQTRLFARQLNLAPAPDGPVTILERFGTYDRPASDPLAHPLLVWAECLHAKNERAAQAAEIIYDRHLIEAHG